MNESQLKSHDFTQKAWKNFYSVIGTPDFQKNDPEAIFTLLKNNLQKIDFSDYLKRYIYKKAEMSGDYKDISIDEYIETIIAQFKDTNTPPSFDKNTTRLSSTVKNWLTRANASRKSVFLLGFGLKMSLFDVNRFLTKGLFQQEINPKDPFEVICGYCYENNLSFYRFERLVEQYFELTPSLQPIESLDSTAKLKRGFEDIKNEKELMDYLSYLKDFSGESRFSRSSKDTFKRLYANAQKIISTEFSKNGTPITPNEITPAEIENIIYSGVPKNRDNGNMFRDNLSALNDMIGGNRLSRQRIGKIMGTASCEQQTEVTRFDLILLNFLIWSYKTDEYPTKSVFFDAFYEDTNKMLVDCFMHPLIIQNPLENMILVCMISEDPLDTFESIWEQSYSTEG